VLVFTLGVALLCGILFGLAPALTAARLDLRDTLSEGGRESVGTGRQRIRGALVIAQVSIALVLLVGAGLLLRSAIGLQHVSPGFETRNIVVASIELPTARYPSDTTVVSTYAEMAREVAAVPGVRSVGLVSRIPIGAFGMDCTVRPEGETLTSGRATDANIRSATPGFFDALGVTLQRGRVFTPADHAGTLPVVVINRSLAHWLFGDTDPIGRRIGTCVGAPVSNPLWHTVVGVIGDMHAKGLDQAPAMEAYFPHAQVADRSMTLVVRGAVPVTTLLPAIRHAAAVTDPLLPLAGVSTMTEVVARSLAVPRFTTLLLLLLGGTGLVLAVIGIYGVIAYFVVQRTREIGMRIALGATAGRVVRLVVRRGLTLAVVGVVVGLAASWVLSRMLESMLFHVSAHDPAILVAVGAILALVAVAASAIPAWRAARVDPMVALRLP
jgi:predicted permease